MSSYSNEILASLNIWQSFLSTSLNRVDKKAKWQCMKKICCENIERLPQKDQNYFSRVFFANLQKNEVLIISMLSNINLHLMDSAAKIQSVLWPLLISPLLQKRDFKRERKKSKPGSIQIKISCFCVFSLGWLHQQRKSWNGADGFWNTFVGFSKRRLSKISARLWLN